MITSNDLIKIKTVIEETFDKKFDEKFDGKFDKAFGKNIKPINRQLKKIQKDITTTINYFDHSVINHENRIRIIEHQLNLSQNI